MLHLISTFRWISGVFRAKYVGPATRTALKLLREERRQNESNLYSAQHYTGYKQQACDEQCSVRVIRTVECIVPSRNEIT